MTIGYREWKPGVIFYVANLPGDDNPNSDWGYVTNSAQAIHLSPYWQRRFNADCNRVRATAKFLTLTGDRP